MIKKSLKAFYFVLGGVSGLIVGARLQPAIVSVGMKVIFGLALAFVALFYRRLELSIRKSRLADWGGTRGGGKWQFIGLRFAPPRVLLFGLIFIGPLITASSISVSEVAFLGCGLLLLIGIFILLGNEEWRACEALYQVEVLMQAARDSRFAATIKN